MILAWPVVMLPQWNPAFRMRYLLTSLKFCSGNFKLPVDRFLGRITSFHLCTKSLKGLHHNKMMATSSKISFIVKRNIHVVNVQETSENSDDTTEDFSSVTNNDPVLEEKLKVLFLEVEVLRQSGIRVPQKVKLGQWKELLELETRSARRKYLLYLFGIEMAQESMKRKKNEQKRKREEDAKMQENAHIKFALRSNSIMLRLYDTTINNFYNGRLLQEMQFSQKIVVDCSYDSHMTSIEAKYCGDQIAYMFADNRSHDNPFDLHLCNVRRESNTIRRLEKVIPTLYDPSFPIHIVEKSYLDLFPKEKLVYLTPHCKEEMRKFDHDAVYIIGGFVDKVNSVPLSLAKAKRDGLRMAKLPLDQYLMWGNGASKSLTLNHMMLILLEIRRSGSWDKALQHVPRRKILSIEDIRRTERIRKLKNIRTL